MPTDLKRILDGLASARPFLKTLQGELTSMLGRRCETGMSDLQSAMSCCWDWEALLRVEPSRCHEAAFLCSGRFFKQLFALPKDARNVDSTPDIGCWHHFVSRPRCTRYCFRALKPFLAHCLWPSPDTLPMKRQSVSDAEAGSAPRTCPRVDGKRVINTCLWSAIRSHRTIAFSSRGSHKQKVEKS